MGDMATDWLEVQNNAAGTLDAGINNSVTSLTLSAGQGASFPSAYPYDITIDSEILRVTNRSTDTLTVTRAQQSTSAASHSAGASVELRVTAGIVSQIQTSLGTLEDGALLLAGRSGTANNPIISTSAFGQITGSSASGQGLKLIGSSFNADISGGTAAIEFDLSTRQSHAMNVLGATTLTAAQTFLQVAATQTVSVGASGGMRALSVGGTWNIAENVAPNTTAWLVFNFGPTITLGASGSAGARTTDLGSADVFRSSPTITMTDTAAYAFGNVNSVWVNFHSKTALTAATNSTATIGNMTGFQAEESVGTNWTVSSYRAFQVSVPGGSGTVTNLLGVDIADFAGRGATINCSLRSLGTAVDMRHAGPAIFGATGAPTASTTVDVRGRLDVTGDLRHQGSNVGFFNVTPAARPSAYTQTYATADKTHANPTATTLTDSTGGTANTTLQSIGATYTQAEVANNFADLAASNNALIADVADVKQIVNSVIDDLQSLGILQ